MELNSSLKYKDLQKIGQGGMGAVYLAKRYNEHFEDIRDKVVLKFLFNLDKNTFKRLKNEARIAVDLSDHDNIVKTYGLEKIALNDELKNDIKTDQNHAFAIVMDYVNGPDLKKLHSKHLIKETLIPTEISMFVISKICDALEYAHKYIIHRDISPDNIINSSHGFPKLSDFGIAVGRGWDDKSFGGKASYMSPEQLTLEPINEKSDIYSLGLVAYEILTGINPSAMPKDTAHIRVTIDKLIKRTTKGFPKPHEIRNDIPEQLSEIINKMLESDVELRYQSATDVAFDLREKYLYKMDFTPNENSLRVYLNKEYFETSFPERDLLHLKFLKEKRLFNMEQYTKKGEEFINETQKEYLSLRILTKHSK